MGKYVLPISILIGLGSTAFAGHMHQSPLLRRNFRCPPFTAPHNPHHAQAGYGSGDGSWPLPDTLPDTSPDRADCAVRRLSRARRSF